MDPHDFWGLFESPLEIRRPTGLRSKFGALDNPMITLQNYATERKPIVQCSMRLIERRVVVPKKHILREAQLSGDLTTRAIVNV